MWENKIRKDDRSVSGLVLYFIGQGSARYLGRYLKLIRE